MKCKSDAEQADSAEEETEEKPATEEETKEEANQESKQETKEDTQEAVEAEKAASAEQTAGETETEEATATQDEVAAEDAAEAAQEEPKAEKTGDTDESPTKEASEAAAEQNQTDADTDASDDAAGEEAAVTDETEESKAPAAGPVSEAIQKMVKLPAVLPGGIVDQSKIMTSLTAADVMRTDLVWAGPENTVEELVARMQQHDTAYLMIGEENKLEGIISKSDVRGALSPYLQSMFAKWRSSMDTATLQIKAKWVMSRPVRTVRPDATLKLVIQTMKLVIQTMGEHGGRCMPVIDQQGKLQGLITVFDIFQVLLRSSNPNVSSIGKTPQGPPLT